MAARPETRACFPVRGISGNCSAVICGMVGGLEKGRRLFDEESFREIAPDRAKKTDGYRRFGWVVYDALLGDFAYGSSLLHSGWSGQSVFLDFEKDFFAVVLTTRCGDYDRAKRDRFQVIQTLFEQQPILLQ